MSIRGHVATSIIIDMSDRDLDREYRAFAKTTFDSDRAAVQLYKRLHQREPDTGASGAHLIYLIESVEDPPYLVLPYSFARIRNTECQHIILYGIAQSHPTIVGGEFESVGKKIEYDPLHLLDIKRDAYRTVAHRGEQDKLDIPLAGNSSNFVKSSI